MHGRSNGESTPQEVVECMHELLKPVANLTDRFSYFAIVQALLIHAGAGLRDLHQRSQCTIADIDRLSGELRTLALSRRTRSSLRPPSTLSLSERYRLVRLLNLSEADFSSLAEMIYDRLKDLDPSRDGAQLLQELVRAALAALPTDPEPPASIDNWDESAAAEKFLEGLEPQSLEMLLLHADGLPYDDIARRKNLEPQAVLGDLARLYASFSRQIFSRG